MCARAPTWTHAHRPHAVQTWHGHVRAARWEWTRIHTHTPPHTNARIINGHWFHRVLFRCDFAIALIRNTADASYFLHRSWLLCRATTPQVSFIASTVIVVIVRPMQKKTFCSMSIVWLCALAENEIRHSLCANFFFIFLLVLSSPLCRFPARWWWCSSICYQHHGIMTSIMGRFQNLYMNQNRRIPFLLSKNRNSDTANGHKKTSRSPLNGQKNNRPNKFISLLSS